MGNNCCNNILLCGILNSSFLRLYATVIASTIPDYSSLGNNRVAKISMGAQATVTPVLPRPLRHLYATVDVLNYNVFLQNFVQTKDNHHHHYLLKNKKNCLK